jgi:hypothetical protein
MAQAVSRRPLTAEARVRSLVSSCGICGGQSGTGTCFSTSTSVFPCQFHSTGAQLRGKTKKTGLHNKPQGCGASVASAAGPFTTHTHKHTHKQLQAERLRNRGSILGRCKRLLCFPKCLDRLWGPSNRLFSGYPRLGVKWSGREDDHSRPSRAEVKNEWSCTTTAPDAFMACTAITYVNNSQLD